MKNLTTLSATVIGTCLLSLAAPASAAVIDETVSFNVTGFSYINGIAPPVDPVIGSFNISFDNTQTYTDSTSGISLTSLNIALGSPISFSYDPSTDFLVVGGSAGGSGTIQITPAGNDFYLHIGTFSTSPTILQLGYAQAAEPNGYYYTPTNDPANVISVGPVSAVPEASTWAMMLIGFAGMGYVAARARRDSKVAVAAA